MEKYDTFCDGAAPSSLPVLADAPLLKTEVNGVPSTCQSLHSVVQTINQEAHPDTNSSSLQQPTAPSSSGQTRKFSCLDESRPSMGSIPRQGFIDSGYLNPTVASLHKARGVSLTGFPRKRLPLTTFDTNRARKPLNPFDLTLDDKSSLLAAHDSTTTRKIGKRSNSNPSWTTKTSPKFHDHRRIPHTDPEATRNLWEKVMAGSISKAALLPSSNFETSTGDSSFRWSVLKPCGCEIKEGGIEASTTHFKNVISGTENLTNSALLINISEEFSKDVTRTLNRLLVTKAGKAAYFNAITGYFLKEITSFYGPTADRDQHDAWEPARLIEQEFYDRNDRETKYASMSLLPRIYSGNSASQSIAAPSQSSKNTQKGRGKPVPSAGKPSPSTTDASYKSEGAKCTLKLEHVQRIRPTAVYWLQRQKISPKHQHMISSHMYESGLRLLAPYFTIMMVDDLGTGPNDSETKVHDNLFVIGSIAVYNRYLLKERSLERQSHTWDPKEFDLDLRHYGLVFNNIKFWLWCFKAKVDVKPTDDSEHKAKVDLKPADDSKTSAQTSSTTSSSTSTQQKTSPCKWTGCELKELWQGNLTECGHIDTLVGYINKIQEYGSSVHGPGLEKDLYRCFAAQ
ncbi:MAG: hypothetical protein Q9187_007296 [Circinaria calcarea]